jgi:hypothetical protein
MATTTPGADDALELELHGIPVAVFNGRPDIDTGRVVTRLAGALNLVAKHAPRRLARLRRDIRGILVQRFPCRGAYLPRENLVLTELTFLVKPEHSLPEIAASIVHEGVHARVHRSGARRGPDDLPREERLCRRAELEFGATVPGGGPVVARALASLQLDDADVAPDIDWSVAMRRTAATDARAHG